MKQAIFHAVILAAIALLGMVQTDSAAFGVYGPLLGAAAALAAVYLGKLAPATVTAVKAIIKVANEPTPGQ